MACEAGHLCEGGVAPQDDLVLGVAVCADDFVSTARPRQVAHLRESNIIISRGGK